MKKISAGLLMYRVKNGKQEILLAHPGGPFYAKKDEGVWSFPKGVVEEGEDILEAAKREFKEETNYSVPNIELTRLSPIERSGKTNYAWFFKGDWDLKNFESNTCSVEWPPHTGKMLEVPEMDKVEFFELNEARKKVRPYMLPFIDELEKILVI